MTDPISVHDRVQALSRMEQLAAELAAIGTWLNIHDEDQAGLLLESASRDVLAACYVAEAPFRPRTRFQLAGDGPQTAQTRVISAYPQVSAPQRQMPHF